MTNSSAARLEALAVEYWDFLCFESPFSAILAGESTADSVLFREGPADYDRRASRARYLLSELEGVPASKLNSQDKATRALLHRELETAVEFHGLRAHLRPSLFPAGPDFNLTFFANGANANTSAAAAEYVDRISTVPAFLRDLREALDAGYQSGFRYPKFVLARAAEAAGANLRAAAEDSPLYGPFKRSTAVGSASVTAAGTAAAAIIENEITPALADYADYLKGTLAPQGRESIACIDDEQGAELYEALVRNYTSLPVSGAHMHQLGLEEVDRLRGELESTAAEAGYSGKLSAYKSYLTTHPDFYADSAQKLLTEVRALCKQIDQKLPGYFARLPRITYGVESIPEALAESMPPAYAQPSPSDNSAPGIFWVTSQTDKCPRYMYPSLAAHEAWPGHLMQIALMQEQTQLPKFRRHGALKYTACVEGWAMYCEELGTDMDLYRSPHEHFGRLNMEMWRAVRLVVDTGIHMMGWSRSAAIAYMAEHVSIPLTMIEAEIDRYIALPGQALAYQPGNLKFRELRIRAQRKLADQFDIRAFHNALIAAGPVTLPILDDLVTDWINVGDVASEPV